MALVAYPPAPAQGREHHALAQAYGIPSAVSPILAAAMAATAAMSGSAYPYLVSSKSSQPPWSGPASAAVEEAPLYSFTLEWPEEPQWKAMYTPLKGNNLLARIRRYQHPIDETMTTTKHWNRLTDLKSHLVRRHEMASKSRGLEPPPYVNATQYLRILKRRQNQQQQAVKPMAKLDQWMAMWNTLFPSESPPNRWHRGVPGQVSRFTVHGEVLGTSVSALPDTGADGCFISQALARRLRLSPRAGTERRVGVANGSDLHSPGSVEVPWTFFGETGTYHVTCWIIPTCGPDVDMILGQKFLQATSTTLRGPRVKKSFSSIPRSVSVRLLGEGKQRLWGRLNGDLVPALPDTGSDIMLLSKAYARKLGLYIDNSPDGVVEVEFPNGAREFTDGIVRNVLWSVGETSLRCDFYVLDNLCVDVILSKDYLFDHDVFAECKDHFTDDEATDHLLDLYGIRLLRTFGAALEQLADESIDDMTSPDAFSTAMVNREWARRDRIYDEIENLPSGQRTRAEAEEAERCRLWDEARAEHERRWAQSGSAATASSADNTAQGAQGQGPGSGRSQGPMPAVSQQPSGGPTARRPKRFRISIPLRPLRGNN